MLTIYVVSDATGETAERMVRSALVQFKDAPADVIRRGHVRTAKQVRAIVRKAAARDSVILHTLVSDDLRRQMLAESRSRGVDSMDLMGPVLDRLATHLELTPQEKPGLFKQLAEAKSREIEAVEFALRHDDGLHAEELGQAEVVLVGVSRTMKTPTMLYLAYRGWFAANVPLIPEIPPPPELLSLPPKRVFCLIMTASRLLELRSVRAGSFRIPTEKYASLAHVRSELLQSRRLSHDHGWREIDVTGKSVEEVAREIIVLLSTNDQAHKPAW
jgi:regulator of PEP synthase PpsR (kinase-PPPase family)